MLKLKTLSAIATYAVLGLGLSTPASAEEIKTLAQSDRESTVFRNLNQNALSKTDLRKAQGVTSVSQLSDVQPTDWAFTSLQSLVERYGCIAGYPDRTYRGQRAMTRYEFAAGLNACMDRVNELLSSGLADKVGKEDLATLSSLQNQFSAEVAIIKGRVDALEAKTTQIEAQQFSVTTKLTGEALLSFRGVINSGDRPDNSGAIPGLVDQPIANGGEGPFAKNTTLGYRIRLNFNTSFTGQDQLLLRLQASNIPRQGIGAYTDTGALQPDDTTGDNNNIFGQFGTLGGTPTGQSSDSVFRLDTLSYTFPLSSRGKVRFIAIGGKLTDFAPSLNALDFDGAGLGSISEFGQYNAIYRLSGAGAGGGLDYSFTDAIRVSLGYLGGNRTSAGNPGNSSLIFGLGNNGNGLFGGTYGAIAQLTFRPLKNLDLGLTYVRSYFAANDVFNQRPGIGGGVGSHHSNFPLGGGAMESNAYGLQLSYKLNPGFVISGWAGLQNVTAPNGGTNPLGQQLSKPGDKATIINWALTLAFPDLLKEGSLAGVVFGQPPKVTSSDGRFTANFGSGALQDYQGESFHIEAFYRYPIAKNISITPGIVVITNPEYNSANPTITIGTIRTTFSF
jgi:hypothetical protein